MVDRSVGKRKWLAPLLAGLFAALVVFAWKHYPGAESVSPVPAGPARQNVYFGAPNSLAVLPFEIENAAVGQEFWSTGFSGELTRLLTLAPGMQVTSRNSALFFKQQPAPPRVIAERLQVTYLLFGGFQFTGEGERFSLRLYNARKNEEVWSQDYALTDHPLFELRDEILEDVASAMNVGKSRRPPPADQVGAEAWVAYLQGLFHWELRTSQDLLAAEQAFLTALELDPGYQRARLALASVWLARYAVGDETPALLENARSLLATVLQTEPGNPEALGLASYISRNYDWDWSAALDASRKAIKLNPGDPDLMSIAGLAMFSVGQFSRAGSLMENAVQRDPLNLAGRLRLGLLQEFSADYEGALSSYRQILGMNADFPGARAFRARIKLIQQKPDSAMTESEQESDEFWRRYSQILVLSAQGQLDEANVQLEQMKIEDGGHAAYQVAEILAFQGDLEGSFEWLTRALHQRDGGMKELIGNFFLANLHDDPRWEELLVLMNLPLDLEN